MLETSRGDLVIDLFTEDCPQTTKNFLKLCKYAFTMQATMNSVTSTSSHSYVVAGSSITTTSSFTMCKQTLLYRPETLPGLARAVTQFMGKQRFAIHECRAFHGIRSFVMSDACL